MSWLITGTEKNPVDLFRSNVSLLLHGDGSNGSTTIVDSSPSPKTVTAFGNAQISTAQSKFGGASIAFDGSGDYLQVNPAPVIALGTENFTVECFLYLNSIPSVNNNYIIDQRTSSNTAGFFLILDATRLRWAFDGANVTQPTVTWQTQTWTHVALVRNSGVVTAYINGSQIFTGSNTYAMQSPPSPTTVGARYTLNESLDGYIDDLRITKGIARYTTNFTPPTAPFPDI
jgi:hypothetical protein